MPVAAATVLLAGASLSPVAFLGLAESYESEKDKGKTGEMQMLEMSRREVQRKVSDDARGLRKLGQSLSVFWFYYIYDPLATGFRFAHLIIIFLPVILCVPAIWMGRYVNGKNGARTGTLWWYGFLVRSMERAGPAFIKVSPSLTLSFSVPLSLCVCLFLSS